MEMEKVLRMTSGEGDTSYTMNSQLQKTVISNAKPFVENAAAAMCFKTLPKCLTITDLGCSSGPNSLQVISGIIEAIFNDYQKKGFKSPEFEVFLNDLPGNDFNTIFNYVPHFLEKLKNDKGDEFGPCFISGVPGSFYGRLFPTQTLHFVHTSYSVHFLSQLPSGIENNKSNIHIATTSPTNVAVAYFKQYQKDFTMFLRSRSKEMVPGGCMVITVMGRKNSDHISNECCQLWEILAKILANMVSQGLVEEAKVESFHIPFYYVNCGEIKTIVGEEGSFHLNLLETFEVNWDMRQGVEDEASAPTSGQYVAKYMRAIIESMLVSHFGEEIIEDLFHEFAEHLDNHLKEKRMYFNIVCSVTKKE